MKMKKLAASMLSVGLIMSLGTGSLMVSAEEGNQDNSSAESEVKVQFTVPDTADVGLYDPESMKKITKEEAEKLGTVTDLKGKLTLDVVPFLDFKDQKIDTSQEEYLFYTESNHHLQVTDRRGTGAGWNVTAKAENFYKTGDATKAVTLPSSEITFKKGEVESPTFHNNGQKPSSTQFTIVTGGDEAKVASANASSEGETIDKAQGVGTWLIKWFKDNQDGTNENVKLKVPARSASEGEHTTKIIWEMKNGPYQSNQAAANAR